MSLADGIVRPKEGFNLGVGATDSHGVCEGVWVTIKVESRVWARPHCEDGLKEGGEEGKEGKAEECDHFEGDMAWVEIGG